MLSPRKWWVVRPRTHDDKWWIAAIIFTSVLLFSVTLHPADVPADRMARVLKSGGIEVHILPTGASIQKLLVPDAGGVVADIVLGFDAEATYREDNAPYFGSIVGRCANRIANASFTLDGQRYSLAANNGPNCLHGGVVGFNKVLWKVVEEDTEEDGASFVKLSYTSSDGEEGFPGTVHATVTYTLSSSGQLTVEMEANVDARTPVNLAQHSYFNLGGHSSGAILSHTLQLEAEHWTPVDATQIPTGEILSVNGTSMDFRAAHAVGDHITEVPGGEPKGYDHNYVLFGLGPDAKGKVRHGMAYEEPHLAATLTDPNSGRGMRLSTTAPGVQLYTGNFLDGTVAGKEGVKYERHAGLALETQGFPNAVNQENFPSVVISPGEVYRHVMVYDFFTV